MSVLELLQPRIPWPALRLGEGRWREILAITARLPCGNLVDEEFLQHFCATPHLESVLLPECSPPCSPCSQGRWEGLFWNDKCWGARRWMGSVARLPEIPLHHVMTQQAFSSGNSGIGAYCILMATLGQSNKTVCYNTNYSKALTLWFEWVNYVCVKL